VIRDPDSGAARYFGLYRGIVADNRDPLGKNRVKLQIPQVLFNSVTDWAWSLDTPGVAGPKLTVGQGVWVQFEGGDPAYPITVGSFGAATQTLSLTLEQLSDVHVIAPQFDGSLLRWDGTAGDWYAASVLPKTIISGTAVTLADTGTVTNTMLVNSGVTINGVAAALGSSVTVNPPDGSVTTAKLAAASVTNDKLANPVTTINGVAVPLGATGSIIVTTATIADGSVTNVKLANSGITINGNAVSLGGTVTITATPTAGSVTAASIAAGGLPTTSITNFDATIKGYRLDQLTAPTASVSMNSQTITSLGTPVNPTDAATKAYADSIYQGLDIKASVRVATTGSNITLSGTQTIDGVSLVSGDRVLVKDQTTASQNGIYTVAAGAWTRSSDAANSAEVTSGMYTYVSVGTQYASTGFVLTTPDPITLDTTALSFVQFSGAGQIIAGSGLAKSGNTLSVVGTANRVKVSGTGVDIDPAYVGQTSITTVGTVTAGTWNGTTIGVANGGTGATSLTGYVKGNGTGAMTASPTIPSSAITTLGGTLCIPTSVTGGTLVGGKASFSAVTAVTLNGVFSALYDNYLILLDITSMSAANVVNAQLTSGGTPSATGYLYQLLAATNGAASAAAGTGGTIFPLSSANSLLGGSYEMKAFNPNRATQTKFLVNAITITSAVTGSFSYEMSAGMHNVSTSYDGIEFLTSSANTMTGTVAVYGFNLS
jgi:hypothetical protein